MDRINGAGHVNHMFMAEDVPTNRPPTEITDAWLNGIQEELVAFPLAVGQALDPNNNHQAIDAVRTLIEARVGDYSLDTGTANAKVVALNPAITVYTGNFSGAFKNAVLNAGACTIDFGGGAVPFVNDAAGALAGGDLPAGAVIGYQYIHADGKAYITSLVSSQTLTQAVADLRYLQISNARTRLTGSLILYVSTTGNDSNTGLSAGSPFLTIQKAIDTIYSNYDLNGYAVTIQLSDGTYTAGGTFYSGAVGQKTPAQITVNGNATTPANVLISTTGAHCFTAFYPSAAANIQNLKMQSAAAGHLIYSIYGAILNIGAGIICGSVPAGSGHFVAQYGGQITLNAGYTIAGGGSWHVYSYENGRIVGNGLTVTLSGTPAFSSVFAYAQGGLVEYYANTFSGAATGTRYSATLNGVIRTNGGGASYLPGNAAGSTATGGQYE